MTLTRISDYSPEAFTAFFKEMLNDEYCHKLVDALTNGALSRLIEYEKQKEGTDADKTDES